MIIDQQALFSDAQLITTTVNSSNVLDSLGTSVVPGAPVTPIKFFARVMQTFAGGTSLTAAVVSADDAALTQNVVTQLSSGAIPVASLTAKTMLLAGDLPPQKMRKYAGVIYTVNGVMTAGAITAGLAMDVDSTFRSTDWAKGFTVA